MSADLLGQNILDLVKIIITAKADFKTTALFGQPSVQLVYRVHVSQNDIVVKLLHIGIIYTYNLEPSLLDGI